MTTPIVLGNAIFTSKEAAKRAIQRSLHAHALGAALTGEPLATMLALLERHPYRDQKLGPGVARIEVNKDGRGGRCFWICRTDGTRTDFSYLKCLTPPSPEDKARAGFRAAVAGQIILFRVREEARLRALQEARGMGLRLRCPVTGDVIRTSDAHVDHEIPFEELLRRFLEEEGVKLGDVEVEPPEDEVTMAKLSDAALSKSWQDFHWKNARLRLVSVRANLSVLRKKSL